MGRLLTISEASELTRLTVKTLYTYTCKRLIPFTKLRGKVLFDEDRLIRWIQEHAVEPVSAAG